MRTLLLFTSLLATAAFVAASTAVATAATPTTCFLSIGDWGSANAHVESIATQMNKIIENPQAFGCTNISLAVLNGDNFYNSGVTSVTDPKWQEVWVNQFRSKSGFAKLPVIVSLGDHDFADQSGKNAPNITRAQAQVDYGRQVDPLWHCPDFNYTYDMPVHSSDNKQNKKTIRFVVVNSEALALCAHGSQYCFQKDQPQWIEDVLQAADNDTSVAAVVVVSHFAVCCPLFGHYDPRFDQVVVPLTRKHRVSMTLTGHSHFIATSSDLTPGKNGPNRDGTFFTSGDLYNIVNGAGRGAAAYNPQWSKTPLSGWECSPGQQYALQFSDDEQGAFMLHRVVLMPDDAGSSGSSGGGFEHVVIDGMTGAIKQKIQQKFRGAGPAPPSPPTQNPGACNRKCSSQQCARPACPSPDPFLCVSGTAKNGCSPTPWVINAACESCCDMQLC